jgi:signal transduction histidine kinase
VNLDTGSLPEILNLDIRKVKQVLFNVVSKAIALTPDGGRVDLKVRFGSGEQGDPSRLEILTSCLDVSISEEDLEGIFKPFEQVKSSTDHVDMARRSGLALAKRLVELQGGRIWAEGGDRHRATTFVLELPVSTTDGGTP